MSRFLSLLLLCGCAGSLVDHAGNGGPPCPDGKLNCTNGTNGCCDATQLSAGTSHTCAVAGGEVRCWGSNENGQLGRPGGNSYQPVKAGVQGNVSAIAAGAAHTCAVATGVVWCWGDNTYGQLGDGTTTGSDTPRQVSGLPSIQYLAAGGGHTCATDGTKMYCWGRGALGQLGNGDTLSRQQPTEVRNVSAPVAIAAGDTHTCAATSAAVLCWGQNADGQLGNGAAGPASSTPTQISQSLTANPLGLGADHSCAVASGSDLWCWGKNDSGQVGVSGDNQPSPQRVMSNVAAVVAGFAHTCAVHTAHSLQCWGLGQPTSGSGDEEHVEVFPSGVLAAAAGSRHTCAVVNGYVSCWGANDHGQLGIDPVATPSTTNPTKVSGR
ncbi:MAG TPA: hypothetical protein VKC15_20510 [Gemmatimonadales bacterium]|nr:hypothetical protein [Gemmatimonadales bacterium]